MLKLGDIIGQDTAIRILRSALPPGDPASAYLFIGPDGVGKRSAAFAWARGMMCERKGRDACGQCAPCKKVASGNHPDIISVAPEARDKKVREEIDIQHARDLIARLAFKPYEAARKIAIIDGVDKMNVPAANALLKTLEEPPGDTVIILIAVNMRKLLPTVISRCQTIRFLPVGFEGMVDYLINTHFMSREEARTAAALSKGSIGAAVSGAATANREMRDSALRLVALADDYEPAAIFKMATEFDKGADKGGADKLFATLAEIIRDLAVVKTGGGYDKLINADIAPELSKLAQRFSSRRLLAAFDDVCGMIQARQWNINPLLAVSLFALKMKD